MNVRRWTEKVFYLISTRSYSFLQLQVAFYFRKVRCSGDSINKSSWADCDRVFVVVWHQITSCDLVWHTYCMSASSLLANSWQFANNEEKQNFVWKFLFLRFFWILLWYASHEHFDMQVMSTCTNVHIRSSYIFIASSFNSVQINKDFILFFSLSRFFWDSLTCLGFILYFSTLYG